MATATEASALTCSTTSSRSPSTVTRAAEISAHSGAHLGAAVSRFLSSTSRSLAGRTGAWLRSCLRRRAHAATTAARTTPAAGQHRRGCGLREPGQRERLAVAEQRQPCEQRGQREHAEEAPEEQHHRPHVDEAHGVGGLDRATPVVVIGVVSPGGNAGAGLQHGAGGISLHHLRAN